jgi:hypothetical protein
MPEWSVNVGKAFLGAFGAGVVFVVLAGEASVRGIASCFVVSLGIATCVGAMQQRSYRDRRRFLAIVAGLLALSIAATIVIASAQ